MSSAIKSKDRTNSSGQKFWHLKKLALGKATIIGGAVDQQSQPLQRPPSPAESAFSVDAISLCDDANIKAKPKSKRLSGLLSHRRQASNASGTNKVGPFSNTAKSNGMPTAMSVQNLSSLTKSPSLRSMTSQQPRGGSGTQQIASNVRQRTMSHTTNATSAVDTRAAFLRSRSNNNNNNNNNNSSNFNEPLLSSPPTRHTRTCNKSHEDEPVPGGSGSLAARKRTLRPATSMVNLKRALDGPTSTTDTQQSPPLSPTSPITSPRLSSFATVQQRKPHQQEHQRTSMFLQSGGSRAPSPRALVSPTPNKDEDNEWCSHDDIESLSSSSDSRPNEEAWRQKLEKEQAVVKALQRQKEACNKDITFLSHSLDELTSEKQVLKQQLESEKASRKRIQDDLSRVMHELEEANSKVTNYVSENGQLKTTLQEQRHIYEEKLKELRHDPEQERLRAQLRRSQDQVRVLKSTMEQFLRMGIFSDDMSVYQDIASRFSTQLRASSIECLMQEQAPPTPPATDGDISEEEVPAIPHQKPKQQEQSKTCTELDTALRELLQKKELLQGEYSKIPISGAANALTRRRKEELEAKLDDLDSQISKMKLRYRDFKK